MEKLGIKETKEAVTLIARVAKVADDAYADEKIGIDDLGHLMALVPVAGSGAEGISSVPAELKDLDETEEAELEAHVDAEFGSGTFSEYGEEIMSAAVAVARCLSIHKAKSEAKA